jgi:chromosome partitioning protein
VARKLISIKKINTIFKKDEPIFDEIEKIISKYDMEVSPGKIELKNLSKIGKKIGFFNKVKTSKVVCLFTTKGGVLKTTIGLNIARAAAISGMKTLVVGLDMQGDMTNAIVASHYEDDTEDFQEKLEQENNTKGLYDYFKGSGHLFDLIRSTDLDNLHYIPETPELILLNDHIANLNRREYWLNDKVLSKLKTMYDMIILDCSPSWNKLTTNALCASDLLISPIECKINNFRNLQIFNQLISEFKEDLRINFHNLFVPTKYSSQKRLSKDIYDWYRENIENLSTSKLSECASCEEAMALNKSVIETKPSARSANELKELLFEINKILSKNIPISDNVSTRQGEAFNDFAR